MALTIRGWMLIALVGLLFVALVTELSGVRNVNLSQQTPLSGHIRSQNDSTSLTLDDTLIASFIDIGLSGQGCASLKDHELCGANAKWCTTNVVASACPNTCDQCNFVLPQLEIDLPSTIKIVPVEAHTTTSIQRENVVVSTSSPLSTRESTKTTKTTKITKTTTQKATTDERTPTTTRTTTTTTKATTHHTPAPGLSTEERKIAELDRGVTDTKNGDVVLSDRDVTDPVLSDELSVLLLDAALAAPSCVALTADKTPDADVCTTSDVLLCSDSRVKIACPIRCHTCDGVTTQPNGVVLPPSTPSSITTLPSSSSTPSSSSSSSSSTSSSSTSSSPSSSSSTSSRLGPRCTNASCAFEFPQPDDRAVTSFASLPTFTSACVGLGNVNTLEKFSATSVVTCREACVNNVKCMAWTHDARKSSDIEIGSCFLHPFISPSTRKMLPSDPGCTSGLVRTNVYRDDLESPSPTLTTPVSSARAALDELAILKSIHVPSVGQCSRHVCLDVFHCAAKWDEYEHGKNFAIVLTHDLEREPKGRDFIEGETHQRRLQAGRAHGVDVVLVVPNNSIARFPLTSDELDALAKHNVKVEFVSWIVPPNMIHKIEGCSKKDLIRLHAFVLTNYDAVVVYDSDVLIQGDITPVLKCAAQNVMLSSTGPLSPLNLGFFAVKPDPRLLMVAVEFAQTVDYTREDGWGKMRHTPSGGPFTGAACGQGFFWSVFFKNGEAEDSDELNIAYKHANVTRPQAFLIDRCVWDFQVEMTVGEWGRGNDCSPTFSCDQVRVLHKKIRPGSPQHQGGKGCFYYEK